MRVLIKKNNNNNPKLLNSRMSRKPKDKQLAQPFFLIPKTTQIRLVNTNKLVNI